MDESKREKRLEYALQFIGNGISARRSSTPKDLISRLDMISNVVSIALNGRIEQPVNPDYTPEERLKIEEINKMLLALFDGR